MRALIILTVDLPSPEDAAAVLKAIDPPNIPHFAGDARITVDPWASEILRFLDAEEVDGG